MTSTSLGTGGASAASYPATAMYGTGGTTGYGAAANATKATSNSNINNDPSTGSMNTSVASAFPGMSSCSSIASLRLKAKQHYGDSYGCSLSPSAATTTTGEPLSP